MRYLVGIDLGTTNSALAWIDLDERPRRVHAEEVLQLVAPGDAARRPTLPSLLYLPGEHEVPASFDEVARELTVEAARRAGLERLVLLEEPQAAFYSWMESQRGARELATDLLRRGGETVLVCDIGGGTTDFSVIRSLPSDDG